MEPRTGRDTLRHGHDEVLEPEEVVDVGPNGAPRPSPDREVEELAALLEAASGSAAAALLLALVALAACSSSA